MAAIQFTKDGFLRGFRLAIPLALSVFVYGLVFGMLASQRGLQISEALLMSFSVFAGASQIIAMDLWDHPLPIVAIVITTFVVNARHLLMGAAVQPYLKGLKRWQSYGGLFFCADENWALSVKAFRNGERDAAFLAGGGFAIYVAWAAATYLGYMGGFFIQDPALYGLDFAFVSVFIALLVGMWNGRGDFLPWLVAAVVAIVVSKFLPGKWYILIGALLGSLVGVFRYER